MIQPAGDQAFIWSSPLECGQDLWFASNQRNAGKVMGDGMYVITCARWHKSVAPVLLETPMLSPLLALKQTAMNLTATGREFYQQPEGAWKWIPGAAADF